MEGVLAVLSILLASALGAETPAAQPAAASTPAACPSPRQLGAALNALVPGLASAAPAATPLPLAGNLRLDVARASEGDLRVDLLDAHGEVVLHRALPAPPRGHAPDCPALAETIALIVDRYLHDVGYEAPPLPLPPRAPTPASPPAVATAPAESAGIQAQAPMNAR